MSMTSVLVDSAAMAEVLVDLQADPWVAFDTEFLRERTYYPQLCLIQIASPRFSFCIDALQITDLSPLHEFLGSTARYKIAHAARQDLEALARLGSVAMSPLFDTQIAAALAGYSEQVSYAWLVEECCGVVLDKSQTRTDWSQRPLAPEQITYALADVRYLAELRDQLTRALEPHGKHAWLMEEGERMVDSLSLNLDPGLAWRRVRGITSLAPVAVARARILASWREQLAQTLDRPRGWLLKDEALLALAAQGPTDIVALARIDGLAPATIRRHGEELLGLLGQRHDLDPIELALMGNWRLTPVGQALLTDLQNLVKACAEEINVAPTLIASRKDLEALLLEDAPSRLTTGWRASLIGTSLIDRVASVPIDDRRVLMPPRG
jgi:ribonuclease D